MVEPRKITFNVVHLDEPIPNKRDGKTFTVSNEVMLKTEAGKTIYLYDIDRDGRFDVARELAVSYYVVQDDKYLKKAQEMFGDDAVLKDPETEYLKKYQDASKAMVVTAKRLSADVNGFIAGDISSADRISCNKNFRNGDYVSCDMMIDKMYASLFFSMGDKDPSSARVTMRFREPDLSRGLLPDGTRPDGLCLNGVRIFLYGESAADMIVRLKLVHIDETCQ